MTGLLERKNRHYPLLLKRKIAFEVVTKQKGLSEASREYDIPKNNIEYRVKKLETGILQEQTKEVLSSPDMKKSKEKANVNFEKQIQALQKENYGLSL